MNSEIHTVLQIALQKNQLANRMLISTNMHLLKGHNKITEPFDSVCSVNCPDSARQRGQAPLFKKKEKKS